MLPDDVTPGSQIVGSTMYTAKCKQCADALVIARLSGPGQNWRAFEATPIERNGLRFYRKHVCGQRKLLHRAQS